MRMRERPTSYKLDWGGPQSLSSRKWVCWQCAADTGNDKGLQALETTPSGNNGYLDRIYICPVCYAPTYFDHNETQYPGASFGEKLEFLPPIVSRVYDEARDVMTVSAYHAAGMLCRKLLMHIAVEQLAPENKTFKFYVDHLVSEGFIPKASKVYAEHIKELGNDATHEIREFTIDEAKEMISFLEMVCRTIYEYPGRLKPAESPGGQSEGHAVVADQEVGA